jgi:hypothetical protein
MLAIRLGGDAVTTVPDKSGFIGDLKAFVRSGRDSRGTDGADGIAAHRTDRARQAVMTAKPFDPRSNHENDWCSRRDYPVPIGAVVRTEHVSAGVVQEPAGAAEGLARACRRWHDEGIRH